MDDENATYDLVVTYTPEGGEAVTVTPDENGNITLPGYGTYVINAVATGTGDYEGTVEAEPKTITIEQPVAPEPVITFATAADGGVDISVEPCTSYEVIVDGVNVGMVDHVAPIYDATQTVVVNATNAPDGYVPATATDNTTVAAKPYAPAVNPVITFNEGDNGLTITVDPYTSYEVIVDGVNKGEINYVDKTWEAQVVVVNAVNEPQYQEKGEASETYNLPALANMDLLGHVVFGAVDQETGKVHVTYTGEEEVTITVTCTEVREVLPLDENNDVQLPHYGKFNLVGEAKAPHYNTLTEDAVEREWLEPETTTTAPDINAGVNEETHTFDIVATGANADDAVTLYVTWYDGEGTAHNETVTGTGSASFSLPQTEDVQYVSYWASALNPADDNAGVNNGAQYVEVPAYVPTPENKDFQGTVTVSVDDQGNVTAVYNPAEGEDVTPTIVCDPNKLTQYGENIPVEVTVSAPGYNDRTYNETVDYPEPTLPQTAAPTFQQRAELGEIGQWITITETEPSTIYYRYAVNGEEYTDWMEYTGEIAFTTPGTYAIQAYAIAPNKSASTEITLEFVVSKYPTSIEELMSAKDVAGVHYYNLAGQQMKEINGFTIVVVSYTDGSSVAMKVMK